MFTIYQLVQDFATIHSMSRQPNMSQGWGETWGNHAGTGAALPEPLVVIGNCTTWLNGDQDKPQ